MRKLIIEVMAICLLYGCDTPLKNNGKIKVENGKSENVEISYFCKGCEEYLDKYHFNSIVKKASEKTKDLLNYPLSFIPLSLNIDISQLENKYYYSTNEKIENALYVSYIYKYIAKNSYNAEKEESTRGFIFTVSGLIKDNFMDIIKLDSLFIKESSDDTKFVNRNILLTNRKNDYINITPFLYKNKLNLHVKSSYTCVDKGSSLYFEFNDKSKVELINYKDFNCEGIMQFSNITNNQLKQIENGDISMIYTYYKNTMIFYLPENETDYFKQLVRLVN